MYPDTVSSPPTPRITSSPLPPAMSSPPCEPPRTSRSNAEISTKVLAIVPQLDDWTCPVCYSMAWRPVNLGCCRSVFCIRCIIHLQDQGMEKCPVCNQETVMKADGRNIDFETMDFLQKYFPLEAKRRQKENEKAQLVRQHGEDFVRPDCCIM